ncbi:MAG: hypothetical protein JJV92_05075 [Desulfosarcina sp.]|nr:hypothetical protein [Desulfobacterales bacterium]
MNFITFIKDKFLSSKKSDKDLPALKELIDKASLKDIFDEVESVFGKEAALGRNIKMFLCQRYTGEKLKVIGTCFGIGESGVSQASRRVLDKIRDDKKLERKIAKIEKKLNLSRMKICPPPVFPL